MKKVTWVAVMALLAWVLPSALKAEEGKEERRREGEQRDGERRDEIREWIGTFSKSADGTGAFRSGDTSYALVLGQNADDGTKEKLAHLDTLTVAKSLWIVKGATRKDSSGKDWIAVDAICKKEAGEGDGPRNVGNDRKREGERREGERRKNNKNEDGNRK